MVGICQVSASVVVQQVLLIARTTSSSGSDAEGGEDQMSPRKEGAFETNITHLKLRYHI